MTAHVSFILPLAITAAMITSSTAVQKLPGELEWSADTDYAVGTVVFRASLGRRFENQIPGVDSSPPEDDSMRWYDLGTTGPLSMFDNEVSTQSMAPDALTVVFRPGAFNALYLAGLDGTSLEVTIKDAPGGAVIHSFTEWLEDSEPEDYYEYFFSPYIPKTDFLATDLGPYANCEVMITVSAPGGVARCGMASLGDLTSLGGPALRNVNVAPKSYARITTDDRGKTSIKRGKAAIDMQISALVPFAQSNTVVDALTRVLGVPCTWIGTDAQHLRSMRTFGLGNGKLVYDKRDHATLTLTVEGMI